MKKIFLLTSVVLLAFSSNVFSQNSPTNPVVSNITDSSAILSWIDNDCTPLGPAFTIGYRILNSGSPFASAGNTFFPGDTLTGLADSTSYEWRVKCTNATGPPSPWAPIDTFTTLATIPGCTDNTACNYNPLANTDDGSCNYSFGCTDNAAPNYDPTALCDDGSCIYVIPQIDTAFISIPILCNGGFISDEMQINITQTLTPIPASCVIGYYFGTAWIPYLSSNQSAGTQFNLNGFLPNLLARIPEIKRTTRIKNILEVSIAPA